MSSIKEHLGVTMAKSFTEWNNEILLRAFYEWLEKTPESVQEKHARYDQTFEEKYGIKPVEAIYEIRGYFDLLCSLCRSLKNIPAANWTEQQKYLLSKLRNSIRDQVEYFEQKNEAGFERPRHKERGSSE